MKKCFICDIGTLVDQPQTHRLANPNGHPQSQYLLTMSGESHLFCHEIGPVFGPIEVAHVLVVRTEYDPGAGPHFVASQGSERPSRTGTTGHGCDRVEGGGFDKITHKVVKCVDTGPGGVGRT